jgi:DNA helicase HerA-like ATPase
MLPPASRIGTLTPAERDAVRQASVIGGHYASTVDRESAYEMLKARTAERQETAEPPPPRETLPRSESPARAPSGSSGTLNDLIFGSTGPRGGRRDGLLESAAKSAARSVGSSLGRQIMRGVLGSLFGGRRR